MPIALGAALAASAGASLLGQGINAYSAGRMNKRAERFSNEMYAKQRADALSDWNMQNAYNDPAAQMQRLQAAGLNPNLVYGNGADATASSAPRAANQSTPRYETPKMDLGGVVFNALQAKQLQANIARTEADTEYVRAKTTGATQQNQLFDAIGIKDMRERYAWASDKVAVESQRANSEYEAFKAGTDYNFGKGSIAAKAARAGFDRTIQELKNSKELGNIRSAEAAIKQFEKRLTDQGISPNTPWYFKILGDALQEGGFLRYERGSNQEVEDTYFNAPLNPNR